MYDVPKLPAEEQTYHTDVAVDAIANTVEVLLRCLLPEAREWVRPLRISFINTTALERYVNKVHC